MPLLLCVGQVSLVLLNMARVVAKHSSLITVRWFLIEFRRALKCPSETNGFFMMFCITQQFFVLFSVLGSVHDYISMDGKRGYVLPTFFFVSCFDESMDSHGD